MKRIALLLSLLLATMLAGSGSVAAATSTFSMDYYVSVVGNAEKFTAPKMEQFLNHEGYNVQSCIKVDQAGQFTTTRDFGVIVIKNDQRLVVHSPAPAGTYTTDKGVSHWYKCDPQKKKDKPVLNYGGRILGPCGDPYYTARAWNGNRSTRPVTIVLEIRNGPTLWRRTLQPGQSVKPPATWVRGGHMLILRRGNGDIIDRERTVTGTFPWSECRNG